MKTRLNIQGVEQKPNKNGQLYNSIKTNEGGMPCFDTKVVAVLQQHIGKDVDVEVVDNKGYKNITALYLVHADVQTQAAQPAQQQTQQQSSFYDSGKAKQASMILSYVKDMVVAGIIPKEEFKAAALAMKELHEELSK